MGMIRDRFGVSGISTLAVCLLLGLCPVGTAWAQPEAGEITADERRIALLESKPRALGILEASGRHAQPRVRLAALEAAQHAPELAFDMARSGMGDANPAVRFAALVAVGKLQITELADAAEDLLRDQNPSVRAAAIYALRSCGRNADLNPIVPLLASDNPSTRANAAMVIGYLGDDQALPMLADMAGMPMPRASSAEREWVRLQFAESMIRLDPDNAEVLATIRAALYSPMDDLRILAIQILGEVGDRSVLEGLAYMVEDDNPIQVRIAAAQAIARMGDPRGGPALIAASAYDTEQLRDDLREYLRALSRNDPERGQIQALLNDPDRQAVLAAEVRAQAAIAMGWLESTASARRLAELLADPSPIVQVAAASSILKASR